MDALLVTLIPFPWAGGAAFPARGSSSLATPTQASQVGLRVLGPCKVLQCL